MAEIRLPESIEAAIDALVKVANNALMISQIHGMPYGGPDLVTPLKRAVAAALLRAKAAQHVDDCMGCQNGSPRCRVSINLRAQADALEAGE